MYNDLLDGGDDDDDDDDEEEEEINIDVGGSGKQALTTQAPQPQSYRHHSRAAHESIQDASILQAIQNLSLDMHA